MPGFMHELLQYLNRVGGGLERNPVATRQTGASWLGKNRPIRPGAQNLPADGGGLA